MSNFVVKVLIENMKPPAIVALERHLVGGMKADIDIRFSKKKSFITETPNDHFVVLGPHVHVEERFLGFKINKSWGFAKINLLVHLSRRYRGVF